MQPASLLDQFTMQPCLPSWLHSHLRSSLQAWSQPWLEASPSSLGAVQGPFLARLWGCPGTWGEHWRWWDHPEGCRSPVGIPPGDCPLPPRAQAAATWSQVSAVQPDMFFRVTLVLVSLGWAGRHQRCGGSARLEGDQVVTAWLVHTLGSGFRVQGQCWVSTGRVLLPVLCAVHRVLSLWWHAYFACSLRKGMLAVMQGQRHLRGSSKQGIGHCLQAHLVWLAFLRRSSGRRWGSIPRSIACGLGGLRGRKGIWKLPQRLHVLPSHPLDDLRIGPAESCSFSCMTLAGAAPRAENHPKP